MRLSLRITELLFHVISYLLFRHAIVVLASVILVIRYLVLARFDPTRIRNCKICSYPILSVPRIAINPYQRRRLIKVQTDLTTFFMLLIELNVQDDIRGTIMRDIIRATFATQTTERAAILVRLITTVHSLNGTERIQRDIDNMMMLYPIGKLQKENVTEEMLNKW